METIDIKAIVLVIIFLSSLLCSLLPLKFASFIHHTADYRRRRTYKRILSLLSCFGGGVFLAACLLDLYPDVQENLQDAFKQLNFTTKFPLVEFIVSIGFFIVFITEQIVLFFKERQQVTRENEPLLQQDNPALNRTYGNTQSSSYAVNDNDHDHSMLVSIHEDPNSHSQLRTFVLLLAVSLHSVFEGLALGLQTKLSHLWQLLIAVGFHKCIIALSLGLNLIQTRFKARLVVFFSFVFSVATPLGIGVGMGVLRMDQSYDTILVAGLLQGLACGTFLYVTFFEILPHEMNNKSDRLLKVINILFGFSTISLAIYFSSFYDGT